MSIAASQPVEIEPGAWLISYLSTEADPTYCIYKYGLLIAITKKTSWVVRAASGEHPVIEVRDDTDSAANGYPRQVELQWGRGTAIEYYKVEYYEDAAWNLKAKIYDDGSQYFSWMSLFLADCTTHQFRVVPYGTNGNAGTAKSWSILVVGYPDVPDVEITYNSVTGKFTASEA